MEALMSLVAGGGVFCVGGVLLLAVILYYARTPCPNCGRRGTMAWLYAKKNGDRDLRYNNNVYYCTACKWDRVNGTPEQARQRVEEHIQRVVAEHRAQAVAELTRLQEQAPGRAVVAVLKGVAKADRQMVRAEEDRIVAAVLELFPDSWAEQEVRSWLPHVDIAEAPTVQVGRLLPEHRERVWQFAQALAGGDGNCTPAEKRRLAAIRQALDGQAEG